MNTVFGLLMVIGVVMAMAFILEKVWGGWNRRSMRHVRLANIAEGTWCASVNKLSDAAITTRGLLYKFGSDADHIAVAGATDVAIGVVNDEIATADLTDVYVAVDLLGKGGTKKMVANGAIAVGNTVYQAASGKVSATGTRPVGRALTASASDGDTITVDDTLMPAAPAGYVLMFMGQRTWAAGAAATEGFAVTGVLSTDLVLASWNVVAGTITALKVAPTADTLTATTSANMANGDKYTYAVYRAA